MVRGLDYYCRTTFEFITADLGSQAAVMAGGRYDGLVELLGGPKDSPGIGFAIGMERLVLLLQQQEQAVVAADTIDLYLAGIGEQGVLTGFTLANAMRARKFSVAMDHEGRSLKSQMKQANKAGARFVFIIGDTELASGRGILRNMLGADEQQEVELSAAALAAALTQGLP